MDVSLVLIPVLAVLAPLAARALRRWVQIPIIVFEMVLGILVGPAVLGWAHDSDFVATLSSFGLAMLFFVAGTEIDLSALGGRIGLRAGLGWIVSVGLGILLGFLVLPGPSAFIVGIALCTTSLGTLLPIIRDAGEMTTPFGRSIGALGAVGEFGPLLAIALLLGGRSASVSALVLAVFLVIAAGAVWYALRVPRGRLHHVVSATLHTSAQYAIRLVFLILAGLVALSLILDVDMLLGAFTAGFVWRLLMRDADPGDAREVESKIEAVAFGFLVPVFFIYTGVTFDLQALIDRPLLLLLVPVATIALLVVRGIPSMAAAPVGAVWRERIAVGMFASTALPIVVVVTGIGVRMDILDSALSAVIVGGAMLSVLVFPLVSLAIRRREDRAVRADDAGEAAAIAEETLVAAAADTASITVADPAHSGTA